MKLIGNLKDKVDKANNKEEARDIIANAGMELTMDELELVAGGREGENTRTTWGNNLIKM